MAFYDNYHQFRSQDITQFGEKMVNYWNNFFLDKISHFYSQKDRPIKILEIGPGKGYLARTAIDRGFDYQAIEANKTMAQQLSEQNFNVIQKFVPPLKLKRKVDVIIMDQVFEHMLDWQTAARLLQDINTHLFPKGLLVISSPDISFWGSDFFVGDYTHTFPTSIQNLHQICQDNNYKILESGNYSLFSRNRTICKLITVATRTCYALGIFGLLFGQKSFKIKSSLLPSCYVICQSKPF